MHGPGFMEWPSLSLWPGFMEWPSLSLWPGFEIPIMTLEVCEMQIPKCLCLRKQLTLGLAASN